LEDATTVFATKRAQFISFFIKALHGISLLSQGCWAFVKSIFS
jgi:hypothetical protein